MVASLTRRAAITWSRFPTCSWRQRRPRRAVKSGSRVNHEWHELTRMTAGESRTPATTQSDWTRAHSQFVSRRLVWCVPRRSTAHGTNLSVGARLLLCLATKKMGNLWECMGNLQEIAASLTRQATITWSRFPTCSFRQRRPRRSVKSRRRQINEGQKDETFGPRFRHFSAPNSRTDANPCAGPAGWIQFLPRIPA